MQYREEENWCLQFWMHAPPRTGAKRANIIQPIIVVKKRAKVIKDVGPHEHFGSPLNICRICGEKYSYVPKPHNVANANKN